MKLLVPVIVRLGLVLASGCAVAIDPDPSPTEPSDAGKSPMRGNDAAMLGPDDSATMDRDSGSQSSCASTFSGTIATFDFTGEPGNQASTPVKTTAPNVMVTAFMRGGVTAVTGVNSINSSNWPTASMDATRYYSFSITPPNGCTLDLSSIAIDTKASGTGPAQGAAATSDDAYKKTASFTTGTVTNVSLTVSGSAKSVEVRLYGFSAGAMTGTLRVENTLTVTGALN